MQSDDNFHVQELLNIVSCFPWGFAMSEVGGSMHLLLAHKEKDIKVIYAYLFLSIGKARHKRKTFTSAQMPIFFQYLLLQT